MPQKFLRVCCCNDQNECSRKEMEEATMKPWSNNHTEPGGRERRVLSKQNRPQRERKYTTNPKEPGYSIMNCKTALQQPLVNILWHLHCHQKAIDRSICGWASFHHRNWEVLRLPLTLIKRLLWGNAGERVLQRAKARHRQQNACLFACTYLFVCSLGYKSAWAYCDGLPALSLWKPSLPALVCLLAVSPRRDPFKSRKRQGVVQMSGRMREKYLMRQGNLEGEESNATSCLQCGLVEVEKNNN